MRCGLSLRKSCFAAVVCFLLLMLSYPDPAWAGTFQYEIDEQNHYDSSNWMAGIADERYLHEINIPGAHDACAKHVWTLHNYTNTYYNYAITQCNTVTELLNSGVRMLDFRVTNCQRELIEVSKLGPKLNTLSKDSLFLSHGQYNGSIDALYYCIGENGLFIELNDALKDVHSWLLSHPTETVVIELKSEYDDSAVNTDLPNVYDTLKKKVDSCSWIYKDQEIPTLGDVRGRAVLASSRVDLLQRGLNVETDDKSGKRYVNGTDYYYENHYEYRPGPKKEEVKKFYQMYTARLSKEICSNVSDNPMYYVMSSSNVWQVLFGSNPRDIAEVVNPYLYNAANGLFKDRDGRKLGWVYSDFVCDMASEDYQSSASYVWMSNYPDYEKHPDCEGYYYKITFQNEKGKTLGEYHVLKGASLVAPQYAYSFAGWKDKADKDGNEIYQGRFTPKSDKVLVPVMGMTWAYFQDWVRDHGGEDVSYTLMGDLIAGDSDSEIILPPNTTLHLNLNGHNIYAPGSKMAFLVGNQGSKLYITGPGTIYGGKNVAYYAGVILIGNKSTVSLDHVKITGTRSPCGAAAIQVENDATLSLKDTEITANTGVYGAVSLIDRANLIVGGLTKIAGNHVQLSSGSPAGDVCLREEAKIGFSGKLDDGSNIVIMTDKTDGTTPFTDGFGQWHEDPPSDYFTYVDNHHDIDIMYVEPDQLEGTVVGHDKHHDFVVTKTDAENCLTLSCKNESCNLYQHPVTVKLLAPKHCVYADGLDPEATCVNLIDDIDPVFTYKKGDQVLANPPLNAGNYTVDMTITGSDGTSASASVAYTVLQRPVSVSGITAYDKKYDGTNDATISTDSVHIDGLAKGDDLNLTGVTGKFESADAGVHNVILGDFTLAGGDVANYTLEGALQQHVTRAEITKKDQEKPAAPKLPEQSSVTNRSITLQAQTDCEYRCNDGAWQESTTFTGLTPGKEYQFRQRLKGDANHNPSPESDALTVTTTSHQWIYSVDETNNKIIATCAEAYGTHNVGDTAEFVLVAPTQTVYGQSGDGISNEATVTGDTDILGYPEVDYYKANRTDSAGYEKASEDELGKAPSDAGDYIAEIALKNVVTSDNGTRGNISISVGYTINPATGTISFETNAVSKTYGDSSFTNPLTNTGYGTVAYSSDNLKVAQVDDETGKVWIIGAGDATITATVTADGNCSYENMSKSYTLTVGKATASIQIVPVARNGVYTGMNQKLVTSGLTTGGTMKYAIGENSNDAPATGWDVKIPSGKNTGTYYVWYKVGEDENYAESAATCVTAMINPVDKSELSEEIIEAITLYNSICDNTEYSGLALDLMRAITDAEKVRDENNVTKAQVDKAIDNLIFAEIAILDLDEKTVTPVIYKIYIIGTVVYTQYCKDKIDDARKAYDALDDSEKDLVINAAKLTDAEKRFKELQEQAQANAKTEAKEEAKAKENDAAPESTPTTEQPVVQEAITILQTPAKVKVKAKKNKVTVTWKKIKRNKKGKALLKQISSIQVQYSTDPGFPEGKTVTRTLGKKRTRVRLKLQRKKKYYIRVRYVGNGGYSKWSKPKKVKTK